jgi:hypothetical protein
MLAWRRQQCHCNEGNIAIADQGQQRHCYKDDNTILMVAKTSVHWQLQQCHHHEGNNCNRDNSKNPAHQWPPYHHNVGDDASLTTSIDGDNTSLTTAETRLHIDNGNNIIVTRATIAIATTCQQAMRAMTSMMTTTPLQWGWQHQLENSDDTITTRATKPSQIKSNDSIVIRSTMSAQWQQGLLCIDNGSEAIVVRITIAMVTMAKTPGHWRWRLHHNKGNNASLTRRDKGDNASSTMAEMPAHQQLWQCNCDKNNSCHCNNGKEACALTATTSSWPGQ